MRFCGSKFYTYEKADVGLISKEGERFECKPEKSEIVRELIRLGVVSARSQKRNIMVPFSTKTLKLLLGLISVNENDEWFWLETVLEETAGFCQNNPEICNVCKQVCQKMIEYLDDSNCFLLQRKFVEYAFNDFSDKALDYIKYNLVRMIENKSIDIGFYQTDSEDLKMLLDDDDVNVDPEDQLLKVIDSWIVQHKKRGNGLPNE
ncbi:unnamed protein product [Caenorhabditis angaria]|uniref:BACK domain-containing protein n=1 Tax=Caenorhabditis angaria TaxID=860376 RepID=A0A9P1IBT6_9PELO|nr:unnamed protein product [Caenorhabditis angaria]